MSMKCRLLPLSVRTPLTSAGFNVPGLHPRALCQGQLCVAKAFGVQQVSQCLLWSRLKKSGTWHLDNLTIIMSVHFVGFLYLALSSIITLSNSFFSAALPGTWYRWSRQWSKSQNSRLSRIWLATFGCPTKTASFLSENLVLLTIFLVHSTTT